MIKSVILQAGKERDNTAALTTIKKMYGSSIFQLEKGDRIFFYTDGLSETVRIENEERKFFLK